ISVISMSADNASEDRLALAALRGYMSTVRTRLTGIRGLHSFNATRRLGVQTSDKLTPAALEDDPIQASLLTDVSTRLASRSASGSRHVLDLQVLDADQVESAREVGAQLLHPVLPPVGFSRLKSRKRRFR